MSRRELWRRTVHIAIGGLAFLLPWVDWPWMALLCGGGVLLNAFLLPHIAPLRALLREGPTQGRRGLIWYPGILCLLVLVFRERYEPVLLAWLALSLGDGLAPILAALGCRGPAWPWNRSKAIFASSLAFALATLAAASVVPWPLACLAMTAGLLAESAALPIDDNVLIPVATALAAVLVS